jgi:hypothetical protein
MLFGQLPRGEAAGAERDSAIMIEDDEPSLADTKCYWDCAAH